MALPLQTVEALTDEAGQLIGILYTVENLGTFSRIDGQWKLSGADFQDEAEPVTADEVIVSTPINYDKALDLVQRFDSGEDITEETIDKEYAEPEEEE
jgi:hypothetical protein